MVVAASAKSFEHPTSVDCKSYEARLSVAELSPFEYIGWLIPLEHPA